jgi:hypothetical protein
MSTPRPYDFDRFGDHDVMRLDSFPSSPSPDDRASALTSFTTGNGSETLTNTHGSPAGHPFESGTYYTPSTFDTYTDYSKKGYSDYPIKSDNIVPAGSDEFLVANAAPAANLTGYQDAGG